MSRTYKETISRQAEADFSHKRSSPPAQYARVKLRLFPLERGRGIEFANEVGGDAIPARWIASVECGVLEAAKCGVLNNGPVVDCRAVVYDGNYHDVDSNDDAFFLAAQNAFWKAMRNAGPQLVKSELRLVASRDEA